MYLYLEIQLFSYLISGSRQQRQNGIGAYCRYVRLGYKTFPASLQNLGASIFFYVLTLYSTLQICQPTSTATILTLKL